MKVNSIRVEPNDDGTFQVVVEGRDDSSMGGYKDKRYSAASLDEVATKIKEGMAHFAGMKEGKKARKEDKSLKGFLVEKEED
jgi:hypothetical protein